MLNLDRVVAALERHPEVSEWTARLEQSQSWQLYLIGTERESLRTVTSERIVVEVHRDAEGRRGSAGLVLSEGDLEHLERQVEQAVFMASLNANPPFRLPAPQPYPRVETTDPEIAADPQRLALRLQERALEAVRNEQGVRPSSLEIFLSRGQTRLRTSAGVDASREGTSMHLELVLAARDGEREGESYASHSTRRAADLALEDEIARQARQARDQLNPGIPRTRQGAVVISGEAVEGFFEPITFHTSASAKYRNMSRLEPGQSVAKESPKGEALSLLSDPLMPYGLSTAAFDDEGIPGQRVDLVRDGKVGRLWAPKRYADYLGIPATGQLGNLVVSAGQTPLAELLRAESPTLHVEEFSWFNPDAVSGDFVAEVRVGYEVENGQARPVKGGSVSGNVFAALGNARFSRETVFRGGYRGPAALWFGELTIAGQ